MEGNPASSNSDGGVLITGASRFVQLISIVTRCQADGLRSRSRVQSGGNSLVIDDAP